MRSNRCEEARERERERGRGREKEGEPLGQVLGSFAGEIKAHPPVPVYSLFLSVPLSPRSLNRVTYFIHLLQLLSYSTTHSLNSPQLIHNSKERRERERDNTRTNK